MFTLRTILKFCVTKCSNHSKIISRSIVCSSYPDILTKRETITEFVFSCCDKYSNNIALIDDSRKINYSYGDVKQIIKSIASALVKSGVQPGTMVALMAPSSPEYLMLTYALSGMGCTVTFYNPNSTLNELNYFLSISKPSIIFTEDKSIATVSQIVSQLQLNPNIYLFGERKPGYQSVDDLMNDSGNMNPIGQVKLDLENDIALLPYSSGTTGLPKGVMLTHNNLVSNFRQIKIAYDIPDNKVILMVLPLYHIYALGFIPSGGFASGSTVVIQSKFDPITYLSAIEKYKVSFMPIVPPQVLFLLNHPLVKNYNLSSLEKVLIGAAPLDAQIESLLNEKFSNNQKNFTTDQGFGMTEVSFAAIVRPYIKKLQGKDGSVGVLLPNMQCKIVDITTREELPANYDGEIWLRGPNIMKGYFGRVNETEEVFDNEWLKTGDIGHFDDDQYFYITDRMKDLIKVKGIQVAPAELEAALLTIKGVGDCAVVGIPDERSGEVPRAFIVRNGQIEENEIHDYMNKNFSEYKQLKGGIVFTNEIPKAPSGKILRKLLKQK